MNLSTPRTHNQNSNLTCSFELSAHITLMKTTDSQSIIQVFESRSQIQSLTLKLVAGAFKTVSLATLEAELFVKPAEQTTGGDGQALIAEDKI